MSLIHLTSFLTVGVFFDSRSFSNLSGYQSKQRNDPFDAFAKSEYFLLKTEDVHIENIDCDNFD
jgi:hypothetical protein